MRYDAPAVAGGSSTDQRRLRIERRGEGPSLPPGRHGLDVALRLPSAGGPFALDTLSRLNLVRIAVGLLLVHRYGSNAVALLYLPASDQQIAAVVFELGAACLLTLGLFTPVAAVGLFLFQQPADRILLSWSLGSMVLQMVLLPMALLPAGTRWSLDARFRDLAFFRTMYGLWGPPSAERLAALALMAFLAFGAVSLSALQFHLADPLWRTGMSQAFVFTNPYFSPRAANFRSFIEHWPGLALLASQATTAAMLFWEAFMVPLALTSRAGRHYVTVHGLLFFGLSAVCLNLAWLPSLELTLWAVVFWAAPQLRMSKATLRNDWRLAAIAVLYVVGLGGAAMAFPWVKLTNPIPAITERLGALNTDVFNYIDLRTNESYATVARLDPDGTETLALQRGRWPTITLALLRTDLLRHLPAVAPDTDRPCRSVLERGARPSMGRPGRRPRPRPGHPRRRALRHHLLRGTHAPAGHRAPRHEPRRPRGSLPDRLRPGSESRGRTRSGDR